MTRDKTQGGGETADIEKEPAGMEARPQQLLGDAMAATHLMATVSELLPSPQGCKIMHALTTPQTVPLDDDDEAQEVQGVSWLPVQPQEEMQLVLSQAGGTLPPLLWLQAPPGQAAPASTPRCVAISIQDQVYSLQEMEVVRFEVLEEGATVAVEDSWLTGSLAGSSGLATPEKGQEQAQLLPEGGIPEQSEEQLVVVETRPEEEGQEEIMLTIANMLVEEAGKSSSSRNARTTKAGSAKKQKTTGAKQTFRCDTCTFASSRVSSFKRHMKIHTSEKPYGCHICVKAFRTVTLLRNHVNTHTGTRPFKCEDCDMAFVTSGELVRHRRYKHTHEKPFKCPTCKYASVEASKLKRHMRSHTGERPFQCSQCSYASRDTHKLKRHMRTHSGEKPYECPICHVCFTQSGTMKTHLQQRHSKDVPKHHCPHCTAVIARKSDLRVHLLNLHTYKATAMLCRLCPAVFHERYAFLQHQETHRKEKRFRRRSYTRKQELVLTQHPLCIHTGENPSALLSCRTHSWLKELLNTHLKKHRDSKFIPTVHTPQGGKGCSPWLNDTRRHSEQCESGKDKPASSSGEGRREKKRKPAGQKAAGKQDEVAVKQEPELEERDPPCPGGTAPVKSSGGEDSKGDGLA
ncbi:transcriptional repressor CTCFL [Echinops telfairi]|uniref:Transcriptional repressor CTCFL n=1 Tax=Echinops telfairi TaxID=9371 RepID=A0ABM0ZTV1_ECHTE|nr:transcriptional repressor CTCFL [Echinops telfairi]